jgi:LytS/YehU family sensor histidine kinase
MVLFKAKISYWLLQFFGWGAFIVLLSLTEYLSGDLTRTIFYQILFLYVILIISTHLMRFVLIKNAWIDLKIAQLIPRAILLNLLAAFIITLIVLAFNTFLTKSTLNQEVIPSIFINVLLYTVFLIMWTSIYMTYHLFHKNRKQELDNIELKASKIEMELKNLRSQLNPHFLFNSLNSIRALVMEDPEKSKTAITRLSGVLRGSLQMGKKTLVHLQEEKQLVEDYLELEKVRFEERLDYSIEDQTKSDWYIPPFCMQTLVENAIKHGISKLAKGGKVRITLKEEGNVLTVDILNTGTLKSSHRSNGIGLENVKQRLLFQFGENAYFNIQQKDKFVQATIKIKNK